MAAPQAQAHQGEGHGSAPNVAPQYSTTAHAVGSQFVQQYYTVLSNTPRYLHRFYTDISTMSHNDAEAGLFFTVASQKAIHDKVMMLELDESVPEAQTVDCQLSASDGVIVQVTGNLQCKGKPKRAFMQTFFLAVQEKGYFVLNDLFRYLPEPPQSASEPEPQPHAAPPPFAPIENGYSQPAVPSHVPYPPQQPQTASAAALPPRAPAAPAAAPAHDVSPTTPGPTPAPMVPRSTPTEQPAMSSAPQQPAPVHHAPPPLPSAAPVPEPEPMPTPQQQEPPKPSTPAEAEPAPLSEAEPQADWTAAAEPEAASHAPEAETEAAPPPRAQLAVPLAQSAAPLTYAQRLMASKAGGQAAAAPAPARAQPKAAPAPAATPAPAQRDAPPKVPGPAQPNGLPIANGHAEGYFARDEGPPGTSIFVRNLPESVTTEALAEVFVKFGALRGAQPVSIKRSKEKEKDTFAFVDFQEPAAQQAAIAGPATLDGQQLQVVEKKPLFIRNRGRGGPPPGRGMFRGGRSDGRVYGREGAAGGRDGGRGRFLERGASLNSVASDSGRGGRRGRGREGGNGGGRGDVRGGRNGAGAPRPAVPRPAAAAPAAAPVAAPAAATAEA
ncbi:hypothetical protein CVIRNUC_007757 [Coccomyxa viridis]|uniref:Uncharacterized protein n=1 Tax=Coccomyxa viridis TaxID=1274662 RepID=A0AAV1IBF8_9CHLO|nr:hypothetical protein CVIRNUC_007757 [Coccomyxa viridis]